MGEKSTIEETFHKKLNRNFSNRDIGYLHDMALYLRKAQEGKNYVINPRNNNQTGTKKAFKTSCSTHHFWCIGPSRSIKCEVLMNVLQFIHED